MIDKKIIEEASILKRQIEKGHIIIPALIAFLQKIEGLTTTTKRKEMKRDRVAEAIIKLTTPRKNNNLKAVVVNNDLIIARERAKELVKKWYKKDEEKAQKKYMKQGGNLSKP